MLNIPLGIAADRWGRRPLLVAGPLVVAIGMLGSAVAPGIWALAAWRFVAGIGSAAYMTAALVYLADIAAPESRARYLAVNQAALRFGISIGPVVGGLISEQFGLRAPFFFVAGLAVLATIYGLIRLKETRPLTVQGQSEHRPDWRPLVKSKPFIAVAAVTFAVFLTRGTTRLTLLPLQASSEFGISPGGLGMLMSGMAGINLALLGPSAWLADRFGRRMAIVPGLIGSAVSLGMFAAADSVESFLIAAGVLALATSVAGPAAAAFLVDTTPSDMRGRAFGIYRTAGDLGLLIGPPLLGAVADAGGFAPAYLINGGVVMLIAIGFFSWGHQRGSSG